MKYHVGDLPLTAANQEAGWQGHHLPLPGGALPQLARQPQHHQTTLHPLVPVPLALLPVAHAGHLALAHQLCCPAVTASNTSVNWKQ